MKITVLSSVYGGHDDIKVPAPQSVECDFILVTGEPTHCPPWTVVVEPRPNVNPRLASRVAKCLPFTYTDADIVIWVDANVEITSPDFVKWCIESLGDNVLCQWKQDMRRDVFDEVSASADLVKWDGDMVAEQADYYVAEGYPEDYGIWWCGLMVISKDCPRFGNKWLAEMVRWTCQDQIAYSYLLWKNGLHPAPLSFAAYGPVLVKHEPIVEISYPTDYHSLYIHPGDIALSTPPEITVTIRDPKTGKMVPYDPVITRVYSDSDTGKTWEQTGRQSDFDK